jgi:glycosyltransferase involved in cell wall biosynthesis
MSYLPLVSVIIPCYNCEAYIDEGLLSIVNQTYKNIEIICVDNNSSDTTLNKLEKWASNYPQIRVVNEHQQGAPFARNKGTFLAQGEWLQYFDIDDQLLPAKIAHQIELLEAINFEADFVVEGWITVQLDGRKTKNELEEDSWKGMFNGRIGHTNSVLIKKELVMKAGGWDTSLQSSQERDLFFRILKLNPRIVRSKEFNDIVIKRPNSISTNKSKSEGNTMRYAKLRLDILQYISKNQLESFQTNKQWYLVGFFNTLRFTYSIDKKWTVNAYELVCKKELNLNFDKGISKIYKFCYSILGFQYTEMVYKLLKRK